MEQEKNLTPEEETNQPAISETPVTTETTQEEVTGQEIKNEQKAIPEIDFPTLSSTEIVQQVQKLLNDYPVTALKEVMENLPAVFESIYQKEYEQALVAFTADGDLPENFEYKNDSKERFNSLYKQYKDKKNALARQIEAEREANLKIKLEIIEELKALVQKEETLNKTYQEFRDLQERWHNTGLVPQAQANALLETYHHHVENFFNYVKINKELRDLDLKRNLDAKLSLCEEAEKLLEANDVANSFKQLQLLHAQWKEIGPIHKDQKEEVWERFKNATSQINEKHHKFFESLKIEQENNLKIKEEICEKASALAEKEYKTYAEWDAATKAILDLQEEWKHSGTVAQKERNRIFKKFRTFCDTFFNRKREFHKKQNEEQEKNLQLKTELCEKVEAIKDSTDWKATTDKIIEYQKEWKKIGPAPKKYSNKIWARFRNACDFFFENKHAFFKDIDSTYEKNLELKKALIEEVDQFTLSGNNEEDINRLKAFQTRWAQIGFVPIKAKDAIQEEFRNAINGWFDKLNLDEFDRDLERFRAKLSTLDSGENKEYKIINEREKLTTKIRQLETDIHTWENNIGFITKSNKSSGLISDLESKIEKTKQRLVLLQEKLKALDNLI
ncbi:MAG: DUF349 domain-containing protein [Odoribacter sp.]|nr:DUF349 domain-containing protein [Odoribacter sp.]